MDKKPSKDWKSRKYRLSFNDSQAHRKIWSFSLSGRALAWSLPAAFLVLLLVFFLLIAYTPLRLLVPGYPGAAARERNLRNELRLDSLRSKIIQWEFYTENLKRVVSGEEPVRVDSLILAGEVSLQRQDSVYLALRDSMLRAHVVEQEEFEISSFIPADLPIEALSFFTPVKGVVSSHFRRSVHPWADITAPEGSQVLSVLDGTVIFTSWEDISGYSIAVQHDGDIVSIYKNCSRIIRKAGDQVKAGTPLASLAASTSLTKGDHLHLEIWYNGEPVDPELYIKF